MLGISLSICAHGATPHGVSAWAGCASSQHGNLKNLTIYRVFEDVLSECSDKPGGRLWPSLSGDRGPLLLHSIGQNITKHLYFQGGHRPPFSRGGVSKSPCTNTWDGRTCCCPFWNIQSATFLKLSSSHKPCCNTHTSSIAAKVCADSFLLASNPPFWLIEHTY